MSRLISSAILHGSDALIRAHGVRPATVAARAGLPVVSLRDPDVPVSSASVVRFFELGAQVCGDARFGLALAGQTRLALFIGPLWVLLRNTRTVRERSEVFAQNFDVFSDAAMLTLEPYRNDALLAWSLSSGQGASEVQAAEFSLGVIAHDLRSHIGRHWSPKATMFRHARPEGSLELHLKTFGPDVRFNQKHNALLLDKATLDTEIQARDVTAKALAERMVVLGATTIDTSFRYQVEAVVRALLPYGPCSLDDVSAALGVGERSLQKRLKLEGASFVTVRDAVRADLATKYLRYSKLSATAIAEILGYQDATSFSRSYRRWHGHSIREVRKPASDVLA